MKTTQEIYEAMLERLCERTGLSIDDSCDLAVRLYAASAQIESLYAYADWSRRQCFPQTAVGEYLDLHAQMHRVTRVAASAAKGALTVGIPQAVSFTIGVPEGTRFCVPDGPSFVTTTTGSIPAGQTSCTVQAVCDLTGTQGNVGAGEITGLREAPPYIGSVTNPAAFTGGTEAESDEHLRARVLEACSRLPNGANAAYYESIALAQEDITSAVAVPCYPSAGNVGVCISANYSIPTQLQLALVKSAMRDCVVPGIELTVFAPTVQPVEIRVTVWPPEGVSAAEAIAATQAAIEAQFARPMLNRGVYLSQLGNLIYRTGCVMNYSFAQPTADYAASPAILYTLGSLEITEGPDGV